MLKPCPVHGQLSRATRADISSVPCAKYCELAALSPLLLQRAALVRPQRRPHSLPAHRAPLHCQAHTCRPSQQGPLQHQVGDWAELAQTQWGCQLCLAHFNSAQLISLSSSCSIFSGCPHNICCTSIDYIRCSKMFGLPKGLHISCRPLPGHHIHPWLCYCSDTVQPVQ